MPVEVALGELAAVRVIAVNVAASSGLDKVDERLARRGRPRAELGHRARKRSIAPSPTWRSTVLRVLTT
jgi:hypothetical protein